MRVALLSFLLVMTAAPAAVHASDCAIEGIPVRWALAACFAEFGTDDELHPGVVECFNKWSANRSEDECTEKTKSKARVCELTLRHSDHHDNVESCVADPDYVPSVVTHGVGR